MGESSVQAGGGGADQEAEEAARDEESDEAAAELRVVGLEGAGVGIADGDDFEAVAAGGLTKGESARAIVLLPGYGVDVIAL